MQVVGFHQIVKRGTAHAQQSGSLRDIAVRTRQGVPDRLPVCRLANRHELDAPADDLKVDRAALLAFEKGR